MARKNGRSVPEQHIADACVFHIDLTICLIGDAIGILNKSSLNSRQG